MPWSERYLPASESRRKYVEGVIVTFMLLAAIIIVGSLYFRSAERMNRIVCAEHLRRLAQAVAMYADDNEGGYPLTTTWAKALVPYLDDLAPLDCPSDAGIRPHKKKSTELTWVSYWYEPPVSSDEQATTTVAGDRMYPSLIGNHVDGGNVSYMDGHAAWKTSKEWEDEGLHIDQIITRDRK